MKLELEFPEESIEYLMKQKGDTREQVITFMHAWLEYLMANIPEIFAMMKATGKLDVDAMPKEAKRGKTT